LEFYDITRRGRNILYFAGYRFLQWFRVICGRPVTSCEYWKKNVLKNLAAVIESVKPDVVLATYPQIEALEIGIIASQRYNIPLVTDFRDGLIFEPLEKNLLKHKCISKHFRELEKRIAKESAAIITVSEPITNYFMEKYKTDKIFTIENGFEENYREPSKAFQKPETDKVNIVYTGRLSFSHVDIDLSALVNALEKFFKNEPGKNKKIVFNFYGKFSLREKFLFRNLVKNGMFVINEEVEHRESIRLQSQADYLLHISPQNMSGAASTKLYEYLSSGTPIISLSFGSVGAEIVKKTKTGIVVKQDDVETIYRIVSKIAGKEEIFEGGFSPDEKLIERYCRKNQMKDLSKILFKVPELSKAKE